MIGLYIIIILVIIIVLTLKKSKYDKSNYKKESGNRYTLNKTIEKLISNSPKVFAAGEIIELYYELKSYTCVSEDMKANHIKQIEEKHNLKCTSMNSGLIKENIKSKNIDREIINNVEEIKLGEKEINNESEMEEKRDKVTIDINRNVVSIGNFVTRKIREKLDESGGHASIKLFRGDSCEISYDSNKNGLVSPKIPVPDQLTWEAFNAAVEVVINNGGKAPKGSARSKGARLGNDKLPLNSVEGYVAHKVHGVKEGQSAFGPGFVIFAILDWAGICNNEKGFLTIKPSFLMELEESKIEKKSI